LILKALAPPGSAADEPVRYDVTVLIPNVSVSVLSVTPFCATDVDRVYNGWAPSW